MNAAAQRNDGALPAAESRRVKKHFLHPGEHFATREPMMLSTLLGSCVAVCLFDPVVRVMGMNHFLLPVRSLAPDQTMLESDAGRYGLWAMEILINAVLALGGKRENLRAKAFGGANVLQDPANRLPERYSIGTQNVRFVRQFLARDQIMLVAEDLGGRNGRQIHFYGGDYEVYLRRIPCTNAERILSEERNYLQQAIRARARSTPADFF